MDKEQKLKLNKAIEMVIDDNITPASAAHVIGLRELILDAIEKAGFDIAPRPRDYSIDPFD